MTTSGPKPNSHNSSSSELQEIAEDIRARCGLKDGEGPDPDRLIRGILGFEGQLDYWYTRVIRQVVPKYRDKIVRRVNPFVRRIELEGLSARLAGERLVADYVARNFVTAGGWALEKMAIGICVDGQKSAARGIDIQRYDTATDTHHLYVVKSGTVTRNSDIMAALKRHSRDAEVNLKQGGSKSTVTANYAIAAGKTSSTFADGIRRPASAEFWAEMVGLDQDRALDLVLEVAAAAGRRVNVDASQHVEALTVLVVDYIASRSDPGSVDWDFLTDLTMKVKKAWRQEDKARHARALEKLKDTGYEVQP